MKRQLFLAGIFLGVGSWRVVAAQDRTQPDPQTKQYELVIERLSQDRPTEAERLLGQVELCANQSKFQVGDSTISTYAFTSTLLVSTYLRLNNYAGAERVATDRVAWAERQYGPTALLVGGFLNTLADIDRLQGKSGSERESEKSIISRRFPQDEEFGFQGSQPLGFQ